MILSDISVKRPVFASVISLILVALGILSYLKLPLREFPDVDPPIVSIDTIYEGASANVVETRITEVIEDSVAGVESIESITSTSSDGQSRIAVEFSTDRDIDSAANDIRDRVSGVLDNLPDEADPPEIQKVSSDDDAIMWFSFTSTNMNILQLTDYAERYLVDRFSSIDGVARVRISGNQTYSMRIWLDREALAARNLTVSDVEDALRAENVELPAGDIESVNKQFTVRMKRNFATSKDFKKLVLKKGDDYLIRLGDVARVSKEAEEKRTFFRGNLVPRVGLGIIKQSVSNTVDVARLARAESIKINKELPEGTDLTLAYDSSIFIDRSIEEVYSTLIVAVILVALVIYIFLGSIRAMIIPVITVPISTMATSIILSAFGFSINLLTLLAFVLAIGLVVDDAIVVLENIVRIMKEEKKPPLLAAFEGARQVGFAVIATTLVLIAVFVPLSFLEGDLGKLFAEFATTISSAVIFSSLLALTLCPMLASILLKEDEKKSRINIWTEGLVQKVQWIYLRYLKTFIRHPLMVLGSIVGCILLCGILYSVLPSEYTPKEDRGTLFVFVDGPEGASYDYTKKYMDDIESKLMKYVKSDEVKSLIVRAPRGFGGNSYNTGFALMVLNDWSKRRSIFVIEKEIKGLLSNIPGVKAFTIIRQGLSGLGKPIQFVIGGSTYEELVEVRDQIIERINKENPGFIGLNYDHKETKPQLEVSVDYDRAAEIGISVENIGRTLETILGSRRVTTYIDRGEEYDVILEGERDDQRSITSLNDIYVRSEQTDKLIPLSNVVKVNAFAGPSTLNRFNRLRAITLEANLSDDLPLGDGLKYLEKITREINPNIIIDYKGPSRDFMQSGQSLLFIFGVGILITFLVLAGQFESYIHPLVIMLAVPTVIAGGMLGILVMGGSLNIYSQIGLIILVGLSAKNGILIVEFANQLRDEGKSFHRALMQSSLQRFRPIIMTSFTTAVGSIPLIISSGAGAETRTAIGVVMLFGMLAATFFTICVIPSMYALIARNTKSPEHVSNKLSELQLQHK